MANYANVKATIAANVYANGNNEVSAAMVKAAADGIVDTLIAGGYLYAGVAHPADAASTHDANVFKIASEAGTYTNYGGLAVAQDKLGILYHDSSWHLSEIDLPPEVTITSDGDSGITDIVISGQTYEVFSPKHLSITFQLANYNQYDLIVSTERAIGQVTAEKLGNFSSCIITANTNYNVAVFGSNSPITSHALKVTLTSWSASIDMINIHQTYGYDYYGVVVKRTAWPWNIDAGTLGSLITISDAVSSDIFASSVKFVAKNIDYPANVQQALTDSFSVGFPNQTFIRKNFNTAGLIDSTSRACCIISRDSLKTMASYTITPKTGYLIALAFADNISMNYLSIIDTYSSSPRDIATLNYMYIAVFAKRVDEADIQDDEMDNLVSVSYTLGKTDRDLPCAFVSTAGDVANQGTEASPVQTIKQGLCIADKVIVKGGEYDGVSLSLAQFSGRKIKISAAPGERVITMNRSIIVDDGSEILASGRSYVYQTPLASSPSTDWIFQHLVADVNTLIDQSETNPLQRGRKYRCDCTKIVKVEYGVGEDFSDIQEALDYIESQAADNKYYYTYDSVYNVLYFSRPQVSSSSHPICFTNGACITGVNDNNTIEINGIDFYYGMVDFESVCNSVIANCSSKYSYGWGAFHWRDCQNLRFVCCEAASNVYGSFGDGFNGDTSVDTVDPYINSVYLTDCYAHDNNDDGYSDHNGCNCHLVGGLYEYNQKGGVTPAAGSHCTAVAVLSRKNINGFFYTIARGDDGENGNAVFNSCISVSNSECGFKCDSTPGLLPVVMDNNVEAHNCISYGNGTYGFFGKIRAYGCKVSNNTTADKNADVIVIPLDELS